MRARGRSLSPGRAAWGWRAVAGGRVLPGDWAATAFRGWFSYLFLPPHLLNGHSWSLKSDALNWKLPFAEGADAHRARRSGREESGVVIGGTTVPLFPGSQTAFCTRRGLRDRVVSR